MKPRTPQQPWRQQRVRRAALPAAKPASSASPAAAAPSTSALVQPAGSPRTSAQTRPRTPPPAAPRRARRAGCRAPRLGDQPQRQRRRHRPTGTLSQKIHCQASPSTTAPPTSGPLATAIPVTALNSPSAAPRRLGRERRGEQGQAEGQEHGRADALHHPHRDQRADAAGQRAAGRGQREQHQPPGVRPRPPEPVTEHRRRDQQHREAQVVGVDRPLEVGQRRVQVALDRGEGRGHHQGVQGRHEGADRRQHDDPAEPSSPRLISHSPSEIPRGGSVAASSGVIRGGRD